MADKYMVISVKGTNGRPSGYASLTEAKKAAREIEAELQPAFGVDVECCATGVIIFSTGEGK